MNNYYLGIDVGTSSTKATILDDRGRIIDKMTVKNILLNPMEGYYEVDPITSWWNGFQEICKSFSIYLPYVHSLCISSICGSFVPVDEKFQPTYNAIMYGIDTRAVDQIKKMNAQYQVEELTKRFGGPFTTHSILPKILWLKENRPNVYAMTYKFVESNNFITSRLTGEFKWDYPTAAAARIIDSSTKEIPHDVCTLFNLDESKIPKFVWPTDSIGVVTEKASKLTGIPQGIPVFAGACDVNAEALATGGVFPGDTVCVFGSTISLLHTIASPKRLQGFISGFSLLKDTYRLGAATSSGTRFLASMDSYFGFCGYLDTKGISPSPTGLIIQPYIDGARTPYDNPNAKGIIYGINGATKRDDFFLASREALGYELSLLFTMIESTKEKISLVNCMGGLSSNMSVMQLVSNITGKTLCLHSGIDASYGDGILAMSKDHELHSIFELDGVKEKRSSQTVVYPEQSIHKLYQLFTDKYLHLYSSTVVLN